MIVNSRRFSIVLTCVLLILTQSVKAQAWSSTITVEHLLTENENLISARQSTMEKIRQQAATEVGAYVVHTAKLENDKLNETIELISAAKVVLKNVVETRNVKNNGFVLTLQADAYVDTKELLERVSYISENKALRHALSDMTVKALKGHNDAKGQNVSLELIKSRNNRIDRSVSFQEYKAFSGYTDSLLKDLIAYIDQNIFGYLLENIKIITRIESIVSKLDHSIINVRVGVEFNHAELAKKVNKYWDIHKPYKRDNDQHVSSMINIERHENSPYPVSVNRLAFEYMTEQQLQLIVSMGERQVIIPVTYRTDDGAMTTCEVGKPSRNNRNYCFASIQYDSNKGFLPTSKGNPIAFKVPKAGTQNLVISSRLELKKIDTSELSYSMHRY